MKKLYKVLIVVMIFAILVVSLTFIFVKFIHNAYLEEEKRNLEAKQVQNNTLQYNNDPIKKTTNEIVKEVYKII